MSDELITNLSFKIDGSPLESLQGITDQLNSTFTKTEEKVAKIDGKQSETFKKTKTNIEIAKNSTTGFTDALLQSDNMLDEVGRSTGSATNNIGKLTINIKNYNKQVKDSKKSTQSFSESTKGLTQQVKSLAASYISVQALKNGIKLYANFSDQMVRVKGLTRASAQEYDQLISSAKRFGATTSFSASQVGEAYTELAQKGYSVNKIIKTTPGILGLAETSSMGLAETTKILTGVMNAYNASAEESMYYADVIAKGQATASVTTQSLGDAYGYSATRAKTLGYDVKQLTSWIMALGDSQIEGSAAGTGLNATFSDLINKGDKLKKIGVNVYDPLTKKMRGLEDIAVDLGKATSKMTEQQKNYTLSQIFGEQSTRVMAVMMSTGAKKSKDYQKELANSAGTSAEFSKIMNSEMGGSLRGLSSALEGAALSMMTTLTPAIIGITNMITALANGVNWFFDLINKNDWLQSLAAGLLGAAMAAKVLAVAFTYLNLTNPFGWIVIAIGAGIAAITFLEKEFQIFSKTAEKIKGFFGFGSDDKNQEVSQQVSQQVKEIPKHAKGTDNAPGGISLVGEEGPELVQMPKGARVFTANETKEILNNNVSTYSYQKIESNKDNNSNDKKDKSYTVTIEGSKYEFNFTGPINNFADIKDKLEKWMDRREKRTDQKLRALLGGA